MAKTLAMQQSQQIIELQKTTPIGEITRMAPHGKIGEDIQVADMRDDPTLRRQIYDLAGVASDVPDNGSLFMIVHDYGAPAPFFDNIQSHFFITGVTLYGRSIENQHWEANGVYIGGQSAPRTPLSYRLTLYFCDSVDSAKIVSATLSGSARNYGLPSLSYPSCQQLDSIFVIRGSK